MFSNNLKPNNNGNMSDELVKLSPFNDKNIAVCEKDILKIFQIGGIFEKPNSLDHYQEAFIHRSYVKKK